MKRSNLLLLTSCLLIAQAGLAQPEKKDAAPGSKPAVPAQPAAPAKPAAPKGDAPKQPEGMPSMEDMMKAAAPGENHAYLLKSCGTWDAVIKEFDPMTGKVASENKGKAVVTSILGGRFTQTSYTGSMMGTKFEGMGLYGYDNSEKKFTGIWCDTMGTSMMTSRGELSADKKVLTWASTMTMPDGTKMETKEVQTMADDNNMSFSMFMKMGDKEAKMMEIVYTRSKEVEQTPRLKDAKPAETPKPAPAALPATAPKSPK